MRGNKWERFLEILPEVEVGGEVGYIVTVEEMIKHGGREEFFRTVRISRGDVWHASRNVYRGLEYDRGCRKYTSEAYDDISEYKVLAKNQTVFVGFTY